MTLVTRLRALERVAKERGLGDELCPACGVPEVGGGILVLGYDEEPTYCEECGRILDKNGRPLGKNGSLVKLERRRDAGTMPVS